MAHAAALWDSQAEALVLASLRKAIDHAEQARQRDARNRMLVLGDGHLGLLKERARQLFEGAGEDPFSPYAQVCRRLKPYPNPMRQIVERLASVYAWGAKRTIEDDDERYQDMARGLPFDLDGMLARANVICLGCNEVVLGYLWEPALARPVMLVLPPSLVRAFADPRVPTEPIAIEYERYAPASWNVGLAQRPRERVIWTPSWWRVIDANGREVESGDNPLGELPFIVVHRSEPTDAIWDDAAGADLVAASLDVPILAQMLLEQAIWTSHLQLKHEGPQERIPAQQRVGPAEVLFAGDQGSLDVLDMQADPAPLIKQIDWRIATIAAAYGLTRANYDLSYDASSGVHLRVQERPLIERRRAQIKTWRRVEARLYRLMAMAHGLDAAAPFSVDFAEWPMLVDAATELELAAQEIKLGFASAAEIMQRRNPDLTAEQALERWRENLRRRTDWDMALAQHNAAANPVAGERTPEMNGAMAGAQADDHEHEGE